MCFGLAGRFLFRAGCYRLKVLIYGINYAPELTGIGKYSGEMAIWLARHGYEVRVITAPPYYPAWSVQAGYSSSSYTRKIVDGVDVIRCPLWVPRQPGGLKRLVHLASFAVSSLPALLSALWWRPAVVFVVEPPLFCAPAALVVSRLSGAKAWLHVQDYEVDAAFDLGLLKGVAVRKFVSSCERWLMRRFDRVSTISGKMLERALSKGVLEPKSRLFPNWVDVSHIQPLQQASAYRGELSISSDAVVALYSGNMGGKQGLEILGDVARRLADDQRIHFVFCGDGAGKADLVSRCEGLKNVHFMSLQPMDRLGELLGLADIHLLPQRGDAADLVMPSKLTGMLASGRPVVATAHRDTELARVVGGRGYVTRPEDPEDMARAIVALVDSRDDRVRFGRSARDYAERVLNVDGILAEFDGELRAVVEAR